MRAVLAFLVAFAATPALACGVGSDCVLDVPEAGGKRVYRIDAASGQRAALVFAHGYRGSARGVMRNRALRRAVAAEGYALVAAEALGNWSLPNGPRPQRFSEAPYMEALVDALVARHGIDRERIVLGGFSAGAMATWTMACRRPALFSGFLPIAGTYWRQPPAPCAGPAPTIVHIHGTKDRTVPLAGRAIGPTRQGRVDEAFAHMRQHGGFRPTGEHQAGRLGCQLERNERGRVLALCLHPGGHTLPAELVATGLQTLQALTQP